VFFNKASTLENTHSFNDTGNSPKRYILIIGLLILMPNCEFGRAAETYMAQPIMNVATGETQGQKNFFLSHACSADIVKYGATFLVWSNTMQYLSFTGLLQAKLGGRGRTTIYRDVDLGQFTKPIKIGSRLYWNSRRRDPKFLQT
jgi:predicted DNA-binding transcriptional regulator AlpA